MTSSMFPEGFEPAMMNLLETLKGSESSYDIRLWRYEGRDEYTAEVTIRDLKVNVSSDGKNGMQVL